MKGIALVLLCTLVAVQARSTSLAAIADDSALASPWTVHLRIAVSTSGLLDTCVSTLINEYWAVTTTTCLDDVRFIWARFGLRDSNVISPSLVYELGVANVRLHAGYNAATGENNVALLNIARGAEATDNIAPVALAAAGSELPASALYCSFGASEDGAPGLLLSCADVTLEKGEGASIITNAVATAVNDIGAGLVADGVVYGFQSDAAGGFTSVAEYASWIEETSGVRSSPDYRVHFVN